MPHVTNADSLDGGNGTASNMDDFITNKLAEFITSTNLFSADDHWTRSASDTAVDTNESEVFLAPPVNLTADEDLPPYMSFHTLSEGCFMFPGNGYSGTEDSYDQPGGPGAFPAVSGSSPNWDLSSSSPIHSCPLIGFNLPTSYLSHHLFAPADGRYCYAAIEVATRRWRHILFGNFDKFGGPTAFDGGEFCLSHGWSTNAIYIDDPYSSSGTDITAPGFQNNNNLTLSQRGMQSGVFRADGIQQGDTAEWFGCRPTSNTLTTSHGTRSTLFSNVNQTGGNQVIGIGLLTGAGRSLGNMLFNTNPSLLSNAVPLLPIYFAISTFIDGDERFAPIGKLPDVYRINMKNFNPGDTITIGSDDYKVFPLVNSDTVNTVANDEYSGYEGLAYKITPNP